MADTTTKTNLVTLSGTAPLNVASIRVNGRALDLSWSTVTNWNGAVVVADPAMTGVSVVVV